MQFTIDLPIPPSENKLWRGTRVNDPRRKIRFYKSKAYLRWIKIADGYLLASRPRGWAQAMITGEFDAELLLDRKLLRGGDGQNRSKAVWDWLQSRHVIKNDKYLRTLYLVVGEHELGCKVTVRSI